MKKDKIKENQVKEAQAAFRMGITHQYIAKGASVEEANKHADAIISAHKKANKRRSAIRDVILAHTANV